MDGEAITPGRPRRRAKLVLALVLAALVGAAVVATALLLPPALADVPNAPLDSDTRLTLGPLDQGGEPVSAVIDVARGWTRIGTGPFLPDDQVALVSPDGGYRVEVELIEGGPSPGAQGEGAAAPGEAAARYAGELDSASWSTETLASGNEVRYATVVGGEEAVTVAVVHPAPRGSAPEDGPRLVLVATVPESDAALYRPITADLVSSVAFAIGDQSTD